MEKKYFIYITTNLINGKQYIGQHYGLPNDSYLGSGTNFSKAVKKYGKQNFKREILCYTTKDKVDELEQYYIAKYNAVESDQFYNLSKGGQQGDGWTAARKYWAEHPDEQKEHIEKWTQAGKKYWEEHPQELEENKKRLTENAKKWREEHPKEVCQIMKKVNEAREEWQKTHPEEHQKQVDEWRMAGSIANSKKVRCITTNEVFDSISSAGRAYGIPQGNISKCLKGERKSAGKHPITKEKMLWEFVETP